MSLRDTDRGREAARLARPVIHHAESCQLEAYADEHDGWTIGWGHLLTPKDADYSGLTCSQEQADAWYLEDLGHAWRAIEALVEPELSAEQYAALLSLIYNIGHGQFSRSDMRRHINAGDQFEAALEFCKWRRDDGIIQGGLVKRRDREARLFTMPFPAAERVLALDAIERWKEEHPT